MIQDALDVANIQDDIVREIKNDPRMTPAKQAELLKVLDGKILPLTTVCLAIFRANEKLFNEFADPLAYFEICLEIFQAADFRQTSEITQCWDSIIKKGIDSAFQVTEPRIPSARGQKRE